MGSFEDGLRSHVQRYAERIEKQARLYSVLEGVLGNEISPVFRLLPNKFAEVGGTPIIGDRRFRPDFDWKDSTLTIRATSAFLGPVEIWTLGYHPRIEEDRLLIEREVTGAGEPLWPSTPPMAPDTVTRGLVERDVLNLLLLALGLAPRDQAFGMFDIPVPAR